MLTKRAGRTKKINTRLKGKEIPFLLNKFLRCYLAKKLWTKKRNKNPYVLWSAYLLHWNRDICLNSPITKKRTFCFLTGRSRSVYRAFHLSRLQIRKFAAMGFFSGLSKASW